MTDWRYDTWPSGQPYVWAPAARGNHPDDLLDFHVDLGCGRLKKGRIGVDRFPSDTVDVIADLEHGQLPFATSSIESIVSHHVLEHIGHGFIALMDELYRVLKPDGVLRAIVPLFPSWSAVSDPDHKRYFLATPGGHSTFDAFCGTPGDTPQDCFLASFSVPYTNARFRKTHQDLTPRSPNPEDWWVEGDARELRVTLRAVK